MSRVGKKPIPLPPGVEAHVSPGLVTIQGPRGALSQTVRPEVQVAVAERTLSVTRSSDDPRHRALHGLTRSLLANMVAGVTDGFQKSLELVGVGYRLQQSGEGVTLQVGMSHRVDVQPLPGITLVVEGNNRVHVQGADKQLVGEMAARIRRVRPPNRYSGKGIRYMGEQVRLKPGKTARGRT